MLNAPGRDRDDIVTHIAIGKAGLACDEHIGGLFNTPTRPRRDCADRIIKGRAGFDLDKGDDSSAPGD